MDIWPELPETGYTPLANTGESPYKKLRGTWTKRFSKWAFWPLFCPFQHFSGNKCPQLFFKSGFLAKKCPRFFKKWPKMKGRGGVATVHFGLL